MFYYLQQVVSLIEDIWGLSIQGVMLTHRNMFYQIQNLKFYIQPDVGDSSLSLLPPWHIYERACGYYLYYSGCTQASSDS